MDVLQHYLEYPLVKGSVLGAGVMVAATPGINYVIRMSTGNPMLWSRPFTGCLSLAGAGFTGCVMGFTIKRLLVGDGINASSWERIWTSSMAGMASGLMTCPLESIAQNQLSTQSSMMKTARIMHQHYGFCGFFRGAGSMMVRDGAWAGMHMAVVPILSQRFQDGGCSRPTADGAAWVISAGLFGFLSVPINRLRTKQHDKLSEAGTEKKRYRQLVTMMIEQDATAPPLQRLVGFFKGGRVRSLNSALAGGLLLKGSELYDDAVQQMR